jgi:hypothetical protein
MDNWQSIYKTEYLSQAQIIESILAEHEIQSVILNKKDSSYNNFGNCEIFVTPSEAKVALDIINEYFLRAE